jgi:hypothetical protein
MILYFWFWFEPRSGQPVFTGLISSTPHGLLAHPLRPPLRMHNFSPDPNAVRPRRYDF